MVDNSDRLLSHLPSLLKSLAGASPMPLHLPSTCLPFSKQHSSSAAMAGHSLRPLFSHAATRRACPRPPFDAPVLHQRSLDPRLFDYSQNSCPTSVALSPYSLPPPPSHNSIRSFAPHPLDPFGSSQLTLSILPSTTCPSWPDTFTTCFLSTRQQIPGS